MKTRAAEIEELLSDVKVHPMVSVGELIGVYIYLTMRREHSLMYYLIWGLRQWLFPPKSYLTISYGPGTRKSGHPNILIGCASFSRRYLDFFRWIREVPEFNWYITGKGKSGSIVKGVFKKIEMVKTRLPGSVWKGIGLHPGLSVKEKLLCLAVSIIQWRSFRTASNFLSEYNFQAVITDYDRYSSNAPFVLAGRALNIPTVSLVHGATHPIGHYVPVLAVQLWVWGQHHVELFQRYNPQKLDIRIVGNPKVSQYRKTNTREIQRIGLGMTLLPDAQREQFVNLFLQGTEGTQRLIKIHPQDDQTKYHRYQTEDAQILGAEDSAEDFLSQIDVLCVRRSQIGSDALGYAIPIIICDNLGGDLQNGTVLIREAGCPLVKSPEELQREIKCLADDNRYYEQRCRAQESFFRNLYRYTNAQASKRMKEELRQLTS